MGFNLKATGKDFQRPQAGIQPARCFAVIDVGTQDGEWKGKPKQTRQMLIRFELPNDLVTEGDYAGQPLSIWTRRFTASLGEKSKLRPFLEAWRGAKFTKEELEGFDPKKILGKPCLLTLAEEVDGDKTYTNIMAISGIPNGTNVPVAINAPVFYSVEEHDQTVYESLPEWVRKLVDASAERRGVPVDAGGSGKRSRDGVVGDEDEIPF